MNKLELLRKKYSELRDQKEAIETKRRELYKQEEAKLQAVLEKYFTAEPGDEVKCTSKSVEIRREGKDWSFLDIYVKEEWRKDDRFTGMYIANSSFRTDGMYEWVVETFTSQTYYARIAVDFQDDILAEMNQVRREWLEEATKISKPLDDLQKRSNKIYTEIDEIEKANRLAALTSEEGLKIEGVQVESYWKKGEFNTEYPDLQVKWDYTIRNIRGLKILKLSASGLSADIAVKVRRDRWDEEGQKYKEVIDEIVEKRVRMTNINSFLRTNNINI